MIDEIMDLIKCLVCFGLVTQSGASWRTWSVWTECSVTCGDGIQSRERVCNYGNCQGPSIMLNGCNVGDCGPPKDVWSVWGEWSKCTKTCGGGIHVRTRTCLLGDVTECCVHTDQEGCEYEHYQTRECVNDDCHGEWSLWKPWSQCSVSCGEGNQTRTRDCVPDDTVCPGPEAQTRSCYTQCAPPHSGLDAVTFCSHQNPCHNGGYCAFTTDHTTCFCSGDWRGGNCNSMCLRLDYPDACTNKAGIFHVCNNCTQFVICSRGHPVRMSCLDGRIWTGDGCKAPAETTARCIEW